MSKLFRFLLVAVFAVMLAACSSDSKLVYPPEDVVNRVTDFYVFNDGKTFMYLNSNMNRKFDFGEIVLMEIDDEGDLVFKDSLLVPSIAGKMTVSSDEKTIYVTTRDKHGIVRASVSGKPGSYRLKYEDATNGDYPDILKTKKEPYAMVLNADESKLFVTHILNGELSVVDIEKWEVIRTAKLKYGVTEILYDDISGYFLASHKSSGNISLIEATDTLEDFIIAVKEMPIELPTDGFDVRSMKRSGDGQFFYAAFQNTFDTETHTYEEDTAPQIVTLKLEDRAMKVVRTLSVSGDLGELAVLPYSTGGEETANEDAENTDDADTVSKRTAGDDQDAEIADEDTAAADEDVETADDSDVETADDSDAETADEDAESADEDAETQDDPAAGESIRVGDLIFVASPSEEKVIMIDSVRNSVRDEISYKDDKKDCMPYQLYTKSTGNTTGYLFVSCFRNDRAYIYGIDLTARQIVKKIGVLE